MIFRGKKNKQQKKKQQNKTTDIAFKNYLCDT